MCKFTAKNRAWPSSFIWIKVENLKCVRQIGDRDMRFYRRLFRFPNFVLISNTQFSSYPFQHQFLTFEELNSFLKVVASLKCFLISRFTFTLVFGSSCLFTIFFSLTICSLETIETKKSLNFLKKGQKLLVEIKFFNMFQIFSELNAQN